MKIAKSIKKIRLALYLDQVEFSKELGATKGAVSNWEKGLRVPRMEYRRKIIELCNKNGIKIKSSDLMEE